jgi:Flp pilus assembly protein TadD
LFKLGNLRLDLGDAQGAVPFFLKGLDLSPELIPLWQNLGKAHLDQGRLAAAEAAYHRVLALEPGDAQACYNLGVTRNAAGDPAGAVRWFREAFAGDGGFAEAALNLASLLLETGALDEALPMARHAVALAPSDALAHNTLGAALERSGQAEAALDCYRRAVALDPASAELRFNLATALLLLEQWEEGWVAYEARQHAAFFPQRAPVAPPWNGEPLGGKPLLVLAEQGLGDTLQGCRYLSLIPGPAQVLFLVQPGLGGLLQSLPGANQVVEWDLHAPIPEDLGCGFQVPLLSLPRLLGTRSSATIPAQVPYLRTDPDRLARARERRGPGEGLHIGLVISGNPNNPRSRFRNFPFSQLAPLLDLPGARFYNLQQGPEAAEITAHPRVLDWAPHCRDLRDLAGALGALDLLITTDSMPAHLAGALGLPVWTLLDAASDWRWLRGRVGSPWYPTMRLFRQVEPGAWAGVATALGQALMELSG